VADVQGDGTGSRTNLCNQRPSRLAALDDALDKAVSAAYGSPVDTDDATLLKKLLAISHERVGSDAPIAAEVHSAVEVLEDEVEPRLSDESPG
jgi:hypothetical protein